MSALSHTADGLSAPIRHPVARILLVAFAAVQLFLAATGKRQGLTVPDIVAFVLISAAACAVILLHDARLTRALVWAVVGGLIVATSVMTLSLPTSGHWPGYASWHLGAITFVALGLAVRQKIAAAWCVMAGQIAVAIGWSVATGQGALYGLNLVDRHAGTLAIGTLFAVGLRRAARSARELQAIERRKSAEEHAAEASIAARRASVDRILELAQGALSTIQERVDWTDRDLADFASIEGRLRDDIRFPGIGVDRLTESAAAARKRGVDVVLLNDTAAGFGGMGSARDWLADELDRTVAGQFTGRVQHERAGLRVSSVTARGRSETHITA